MKWIVIDTVIQPSCGISFSVIWSKVKLIIWYQSDAFLPPESIFTLTHTGIMLNNKVLPVTIYNVVPFNKTFWNLIKNSQECPTNTDNVLNECFNNRCMLQICPYGLKQQSP
ncbi:anti-adapter protein IraM [Escherichia coli]|uniref:anti-adapter protein IraM n=1 Tax=Escherichia coli TaxID=562 RepID=UPI000942CC33|nr:anti-adapter protein IraM [Escherichia coli]OKV44406.1 anti-adapter protein IraM [Escherichia coli]